MTAFGESYQLSRCEMFTAFQRGRDSGINAIGFGFYIETEGQNTE